MSTSSSGTTWQHPFMYLINRAAAYPALPAVFGGLYFLLVVLNHEVFAVFIAETFDIDDRPQFNRFFLRAGLISVFLYLIAVTPFFWQQKNYLAMGYQVVTLLFTALIVHGLVVVYSELIHFPQYMLLAMLLFPASRSYHFTLVICGLLGAIDEGIQYWYLSPQRTDYFDFNDVVLNVMGSVWGLMAMGAWLGKGFSAPGASFRKSWILVLFTLTALAAAWGLNLLDFASPENVQNPANWTLVRQEHSGFWADLHLGRRFHILRPHTGIGLLLALTLFYTPLDRVLR